MSLLETKYGILHGVTSWELYEDGQIKECNLDTHNEIKTSFGNLVPQYTQDEVRRKYVKPLYFYENGNIKNITLQEPTLIDTSVGPLEAEYISFYKNGNVKRVFPLNGKLTGYWTEEDEYNLAKELAFNLSFASFKSKIIGILFYETGEIKSITFWPQDSLSIHTIVGVLDIRMGLSLYKSGAIKSCELLKPTLIQTPIGEIIAFDTNPIGVNGDNNSLKFFEDGSIQGLKTATDVICVTDEKGQKHIYEPETVANPFDGDEMFINAINMEFIEGKVVINNKDEFLLDKCHVAIENNVKLISNKCSECSGCSAG
ncbi:hypothetical protein EDC19_0186 [Natranaerovirga hydrolytica]|uniref:MORN repeat protein n=1 Tax=Natranaerovirga hydrolytica TaxID=680378 RepID=A0A4R1N1B4_9FIRM|nr:hypothetical protein [Natranaerovirga hydrolytica]TCK97784.1 hypothetical protein EDC19_0186 [Natranaerovirga hydrolytica]